MSIQTLAASFASGEYPIYIGQGSISKQRLKVHLQDNSVMVVTNSTIAPLHLATLQHHLQDTPHDVLILPDGEDNKNKNSFNQIIDHLVTNNHHRDTTLIALGGGVITDLTGFAAACYLRGISLILIPTSLCGQIDASIGGKTAINHPLGKNIIGAFYQPQAVFIDPTLLSTLPEREYRSGLIEVMKAALISDAEFFSWLETNLPDLLRKEPSMLAFAIEQACRIKCTIVAADEREHGCRAWLNLGHTFGHALEQQLGYKDCLHGEAVAWGITLAATLAHQRQLLDKSELDRILHFIQLTQCTPTIPDELTIKNFIKALHQDKKIRNNKLHFILPEQIGRVAIHNDVSTEELTKLLQPHFLNQHAEELGAC